jgi:hypothetical protein
MTLEKQHEIVKDLVNLAKKHNLLLITGGKSDKKLKYQFDGFNVFITDGTPSKMKQMDDAIGKAITYPSTLVLKLQKNRYKHEN